jgi:hypothetical protein
MGAVGNGNSGVGGAWSRSSSPLSSPLPSPALRAAMRRMAVRRLGTAASTKVGLGADSRLAGSTQSSPAALPRRQPFSEHLRPMLHPTQSPTSLSRSYSPQYSGFLQSANTVVSSSSSGEESDVESGSSGSELDAHDERMAMSVVLGGRKGIGASTLPGRILASQPVTTVSPSIDLTVRRQRNPNLMQVGESDLPGGDEQADEVGGATLDLSARGGHGATEVVDEAGEESSPVDEDVLARVERLKQLQQADRVREQQHQQEKILPASGALRVSVQNLIAAASGGSPDVTPLSASLQRVRSAPGAHCCDNSSFDSPLSAEMPATGLFTGQLKSARLSPAARPIEEPAQQ